MAQIKIDQARCKGCGLCVIYCPKGLIATGGKLNTKGVNAAIFKETEKDQCTGCGFCTIICPDCAIEVFK